MFNTKRLILGVAAAAAWLLMPAVSMAIVAGGVHDLSAFAPDGGVCVTCHHPHNKTNTRLIWNHGASTAASYTWGTTTTLAGTNLPTNILTWDGSTKYCLSCHDGSIVTGTIIAPSGTPGYGSKISGSAQVATAAGSMSGNHPVAVPYPTAAGAKYNVITTAALPADYVASPSNVKLYTDSAAAGPNNKGIECGSCHDVHYSGVNVHLLRDTLGAICSDCHSGK